MGYLGFLLVFIGGGIGSALRYGSALLSARWFGTWLPYGTLFVNIFGSFVMGVISEYWAQKTGLPQPLRLFLTTGIIGGFTTFSTFSLDTAVLWERGDSITTFAYAAASVVFSIGALFAGLALVRALVVPASM